LVVFDHAYNFLGMLIYNANISHMYIHVKRQPTKKWYWENGNVEEPPGRQSTSIQKKKTIIGQILIKTKPKYHPIMAKYQNIKTKNHKMTDRVQYFDGDAKGLVKTIHIQTSCSILHKWNIDKL
jgi:hypothetical protein